MTDYGQKSRAQMMARYQLERRQRKLRRLYYNLLDGTGFVLWCVVGIIATAAALFCVAHR